MLIMISVGTAYADDTFHEATASEFYVAPCFGDNMVFQQNEPIKIWGTSPCEGEYVNAEFDGSLGSGKVVGGKWEIELAERTYSAEPKVLKIIGGVGSYQISFENIRIGDVWWVMGQSNAEYTCSADPNWEAYKEQFNGNNNVFLYKMSEKPYEPSAHTRWRSLNVHSANDTSALACYTAYNIAQSTNNEVPIAMVVIAYSGHELAAFMPKEIAKHHSATGKRSFIHENVVSHVLDMPIRGIIWYQGEADASIYMDYSKKLEKYISWLREVKKQNNSDFPIYAVELSPCFNDPNDANRQYINFGNVRSETGTMTAKLNNFNICVTSDLWNDKGFSNNLHPYNKDLISKRLAYMIVSKEYKYGSEHFYFGPSLKSAELNQSCTEAILTFDYCGDGLSAASFDGFIVIDDNWHIIDDVKYEIISANQIKINSSEKICIIRYNSDTDNVFGEDIFLENSSGIPAAAFSWQFYSIKPSYLLVLINYLKYALPVIAALAVMAIIIVRKKKKGKSK